MAVTYNIRRNKMTDVMFTEVYIMTIVWLLRINVFILRNHYIMYTCTEFITTDSTGTFEW